MELGRCPHCNEELTRLECLEGRCVNCGKEIPRAASASHGEPEESPYHPSASIREPLSRRQWAAIGMLVLFIASVILPFGLIRSCWIAIEKGDSICAHPGCVADATVHIEYTGGVKRGYCDEHARNAKTTLSKKELQFPIALCVLALVFAMHYGFAFKEAFRDNASSTVKQRNPFKYFALLTLTSVVGLNGLYWLVSRYLC